MGFDFLSQAGKFLKKQRQYRRQTTVFLCLAAVVAFGTVAALKLYGQAMTHKSEVLNCKYEVHKHTEECYEKNKEGILGTEPVCGYADYVVHTHGEGCYDAEDNLVCTLKERKEHKHTEACYVTEMALICESAAETSGSGENVSDTKVPAQQTEEVSCSLEEHAHMESCYGEALACGYEEHVHEEGCISDMLVCAAEEHVHAEDCYDAEGNKICEKEEHRHAEECYKKDFVCGKNEHTHESSCYTQELVCGIEEHKHNESCYAQVKAGSEGQQPEGSAENGHVHTEKCYEEVTRTICGELELHAHKDSCYDKADFDKDGNLMEGSRPICKIPALEEHVHNEDCFETVEMTEDEVAAIGNQKKEVTRGYGDGQVKVILSYDSAARISEKAELLVEPVTEESNEALYTERMKEARELTEIQGEANELFFSISLVMDGENVQPKEPVNLQFQIAMEGLKKGAAVKVVYFGGVETEVLEGTRLAEAEDGSLCTEVGITGFGQFVLLIEDDGLPEGVYRKEITQEYDDWSLRVIATYGEAAQIPVEAELVVEPITKEEDETFYKDSIKDARELSGQHGATAELLYNIGFFVNGEEIEPKDTVNIELQMFRDGIEAGEPVSVIHFDDEETRLLEGTDIILNEDGSLSTSFDSKSFSPFAFVIGGSDEVRKIGVIIGEGIVYEEADETSDSYDLKEYEPELEEPIHIEVLKTVTDAEGKEWYLYTVVTEDENLKDQLSDFPYIPASDVVLAEDYVERTLTATDEDGVKITVEGLLPEDAELSVTRIFDPEISDIVGMLNYNLNGECDPGDFRLVYNLELGDKAVLIEPVKVTVSNFDFNYYDFSNLSAWVYRMTQKQGSYIPGAAGTQADADTENVDADNVEAESQDTADDTETSDIEEVVEDEDPEDLDPIEAEDEADAEDPDMEDVDDEVEDWGEPEESEAEPLIVPVEADVKKIDAKMTDDGIIVFETDDLSTFYIASTLIEGHDEYFNSLAESNDKISWEYMQNLMVGEEDEEIEEKKITEDQIQMVEAWERPTLFSLLQSRATVPTNSAGQIIGKGGTKKNDTDNVTISKTIASTDTENVFDITLKVTAPVNTAVSYEDPEAAIVIVMDVSNTMTYGFKNNAAPTGTDVSRESAALKAGNSFINKFYNQCGGKVSANSKSRIGLVLFNTNVTTAFKLSKCNTTDERDALKKTMKEEVNGIIKASGYGSSPTRFTNIEGALKKAGNMLSSSSCKNKYIILVTDGFPTTYVKANAEYNGYTPITTKYSASTSDGVFCDRVNKKPCLYGCNYSDKGAKRAKTAATDIKDKGIKIYTVGVALGTQSVTKFIKDNKDDAFATVDITSGSYEIGSTTTSYKNWLKDKIGSGYYKNVATGDDFTLAFDEIIAKIRLEQTEMAQVALSVSDPVPGDLEFIGLYDKDGNLKTTSLTGSYAEKKENTASYASSKISWNLQKSGYTLTTNGNTTTYTYTLKYRVRLKNEASAFVERKEYKTNGTTTLTYRTDKTVNGKKSTGSNKTLNAEIPSVMGYLSELSFKKVDDQETGLKGAEFTLTHDTAKCGYCRGDKKKSVSVNTFKATSGEDGTVSFTKIPSGHTYTLIETKAPAGYVASKDTYRVKIAYDIQTITKISNGKEAALDKMYNVVNTKQYNLPETGGSGTGLFLVCGIALCGVGGVYGYCSRRRWYRR